MTTTEEPSISTTTSSASPHKVMKLYFPLGLLLSLILSSWGGGPKIDYISKIADLLDKNQ